MGGHATSYGRPRDQLWEATRPAQDDRECGFIASCSRQHHGLFDRRGSHQRDKLFG
jgi:hypothetical protein